MVVATIKPSQWKVAGLAIAMVMAFTIGWTATSNRTLAAGSASLGSDQTEERVVLRLGGDEILATTIAIPLARRFLERKGAQRVVVSAGPAPWTETVSGRISNGDHISVLILSTSTTDGFRLLDKGKIDIAMAGRIPTPEEMLLRTLRAGGSATRSEAVARTAAVIVVNQNNPIETLTLRQLYEIYAGKITDWAGVGGVPGPIHVLAPQEGSGTRYLFDSVIMDPTPIASSVHLVSSFENMRALLEKDANAIGYLVVNKTLKKVGIIINDSIRVSPPDSYELASGDYPLTQTLYLYRDLNHVNDEVSTFFRQAVSVPSQLVIASAGLSTLTPQLIFPSPGSTTLGLYTTITRNALRVSTTIHFDSGSMKVTDETSSDLDKLARYLRVLQVPSDHLAHLAFSDDTGDPAKNQAFSLKLGEIVANELRSRMVNPGDVTAFGARRPLVEDSTLEGRRFNRRVETWVLP